MDIILTSLTLLLWDIILPSFIIYILICLQYFIDYENFTYYSILLFKWFSSQCYLVYIITSLVTLNLHLGAYLWATGHLRWEGNLAGGSHNHSSNHCRWIHTQAVSSMTVEWMQNACLSCWFCAWLDYKVGWRVLVYICVVSCLVMESPGDGSLICMLLII